MGRYKVVIAYLGMILLLAGRMHGSQEPEIEKTLSDMLNEKPSLQLLGKIYQQSEQTANSPVRICLLKSCGAGLLLLKETKRYATAVRVKIPRFEDFEKSLTASCDNCNGTGEKEKPCRTCGSKGACSNKSCNGGRVKISRLENRYYYDVCPLCKGSARCKECEGTGRLKSDCLRCGGEGNCFSEPVAAEVYRQELNSALSFYATERQKQQQREAEAAEAVRREEALRQTEQQLAQEKIRELDLHRQRVLDEQTLAWERIESESDDAAALRMIDSFIARYPQSPYRLNVYKKKNELVRKQKLIESTGL